MRLVDRLIWRELIGPVVNSVFLFLMVLFAAGYLFKVTDLLVQGAPPGVVLQITVYVLPMLLTQTLPMAMLLGCLLAFGRLSGDSEHIALFASGISFYRIARPVAWMGLAVSVIAFAWDQTVVPPATRKYYALLQNLADTSMTTKPLYYTVPKPDGGVDEFVSVAGGFDARNRVLRNVTIVKMSDDPKRAGQPEFYVHAREAVALDRKNAAGTNWVYRDVYGQPMIPDPDNKLVTSFFFKEARTLPANNVRLGRDFRGIMQADVTDNHRMTFVELRDKINKEREQGSLNTLGDEVDLWGKISVPLASLIFGLVGAPLGIRPQRGSKAMGFGIAILIIFLYWIVYNWMYVVGKSGGIPPMLASFVADLVGLVAGAVLVARTRQ